MIKPICPCYGCIERRFKCHGTCYKYKDYVEANEKFKALIKEARKGRFVDHSKGRGEQ